MLQIKIRNLPPRIAARYVLALSKSLSSAQYPFRLFGESQVDRSLLSIHNFVPITELWAVSKHSVESASRAFARRRTYPPANLGIVRSAMQFWPLFSFMIDGTRCV